MISAEHSIGIGDLLDEVFAVLPETTETEDSDATLEAEDDFEEAGDEDGTQGEEAFEEAIDAEDGKPVRRQRTHGEYESRETKVAIIGRPNVGKSTLLNALTESKRAIVSPIAGTTRDAVDEIVERKGHLFRFVDTAGIRRKGKTKLMAEKLSVIMARKHLEAADVSLLVIDAVEGVTAIDANIGGYAHESGRSVIIVINKWDLMTTNRSDGKPPADQKVYAEQVRHALKYLDYAPLLFISAAPEDAPDKPRAINEVFAKVELVARERRKRVSTGQMNKFLEQVDFQRASVPMNKRVRIYYMTQAQGRPANLRPLHRPRHQDALLVRALSRQPDPRSLRLHRITPSGSKSVPAIRRKTKISKSVLTPGPAVLRTPEAWPIPPFGRHRRSCRPREA